MPFSLNISPYVENCTRYDHSYNRRRICDLSNNAIETTNIFQKFYWRFIVKLVWRPPVDMIPCASPVCSRTLLRYVRLMTWAVRPSVCRLSVTLLHPRQRLELFNNSLHCLTAQRVGQFVSKFGAKIRGVLQVKCKWCEKLAFFDQYLARFRKRYKYGHSYNGRRIGTRIRSIEWWPLMTHNLDFKVTIFWTSNNSKTVQERVIVTTADQ